MERAVLGSVTQGVVAASQVPVLLMRPGGHHISHIKTLLCLLSSKGPLSLRDNSTVNISNDWLTRSNSKNYHHFFPKAFHKTKKYLEHANHIANITLVDDQLNKREIGAKAPSKYVAQLERTNPGLKKALASHLIDLETFGIRSDDYATFFNKRCLKLSRALAGKVLPSAP